MTRRDLTHMCWSRICVVVDGVDCCTFVRSTVDEDEGLVSPSVRVARNYYVLSLGVLPCCGCPQLLCLWLWDLWGKRGRLTRLD